MKTKTVLCALALIAVFTACGGYDKETDFEVSPAEGGKSVVITDYEGEKLNVKIPPRIQKMPVTEIGEDAFSYEELVSVTIPKSVTVIGDSAFSRCENLTSITIPKGVTSIGDYAFSGCESLTSITIPAGVTEIGRGAFSGCESLTSIKVDGKNPAYASEGGIVYNKAKTEIVAVPWGISGTVTLPTSVTSIGQEMFSGCTGITGITLPAGLTEIGNRAFSGCTGLTAITIPASVTSINIQAFDGCTGLTTVTFSANSRLEAIGWSAFSRCTGLTGITIPASVTAIERSAFDRCTGIAEITVPATVRTVGGNAFFGWSNTQTINIAGHPSQAAADRAWGYSYRRELLGEGTENGWRAGCKAVINYQGN